VKSECPPLAVATEVLEAAAAEAAGEEGAAAAAAASGVLLRRGLLDVDLEV
jgi:hypothetical protein